MYQEGPVLWKHGDSEGATSLHELLSATDRKGVTAQLAFDVVFEHLRVGGHKIIYIYNSMMKNNKIVLE